MIFLTSYDKGALMVYCRGSKLRAPTLQLCGECRAFDAMLGAFMSRDVAQLVARTAGGGEAAGSSPVIPTIQTEII